MKAFYLTDKNCPATLTILAELGVEYYLASSDASALLKQIQKQKHLSEEKDLEISKDAASTSVDNVAHILYREQTSSSTHVLMVMKGEAHLDIRDQADLWIRVTLLPSDLVVLPAKLYRRLSVPHGVDELRMKHLSNNDAEGKSCT
jgi:cupin superfamily acireductone dioxygenase involved in methionine salvage